VWGSSLATNLTKVEVIGRAQPRSWESTTCWLAGRTPRQNIDSRQASVHGWVLATLRFLLGAGKDKGGAFLENLGRISCRSFQRNSHVPVLNFVIRS
jgi:hypothetical protein